MSLKDLMKFSNNHKNNKLEFLSNEERKKYFQFNGKVYPAWTNKILKNITAYMIYDFNISYNEVEKKLLSKQWIKDEGWRLPTIDELKALATTNPNYFNIFYYYISDTTDELNGNFIKYIEKTYTDKIRVDKCNKAYYDSMVSVLVTEKEF